MPDISTFAELRAAVNARLTPLLLTADITSTSQLTLSYSVEIRGASSPFVLRKSLGFSGYLFRLTEGGALELENIVLDGQDAGSYTDNTANRALVQLAGGALRLGRDAVLQNNSSYQEAGGVYLSGDPAYTNSLVMESNARITGCISRNRGGGIMAALRNSGDSLTLTGEASVDTNTAAHGGGVYIRSYAAGTAAEIAIGGGVRISGNTALSNGGGLYFSGYQEGLGLPLALRLEAGLLLSGNHAANGGGAYFNGANEGDRLELAAGAVLQGNGAASKGGGICANVSGGGADCILGGLLDGNTAGTGGGFYLLTAAGGKLSIDGGRVSNNSAVNGASGSGGGVWVQNGSQTVPLSVSLTGAEITQNQAAANGGGILVNGEKTLVTFDMADTVIEGNGAAGDGGGILLGTAKGAAVSLTGGSLRQNRSGDRGGGFFFANITAVNSQITLRNVLVQSNTAATEGGGLRFASGKGSLKTEAHDCTITDNAADGSSGGGIWNGGATDTLLLSGGTLVSRNRTASGNGGGIYFNSTNGVLTLSDDALVTENRAGERPGSLGGHGGGICAVPGQVTVQDRAEIGGNRALRYGGGVSLAEGSSLRLTGGSIHGNNAPYGGGVWSRGGSSVLLSGGSLTGNAASVGGGLYNGPASTATITGAFLLGSGAPNTAVDYAPGIYNEGVLYLEGDRELSNGLYITSRAAVAYLNGPLEAGSMVRLDPSPYVSPNPEGIPIVVAEATLSHTPLTQSDADAFRKPSTGFDGWEIRLSGDHSQILLAPVDYPITYENLMGASNPNPLSYRITSPDIVLAAPGPLPGYRFEGWYDRDGNRVEVIPQGSSGELTLCARWTPLPAGCYTLYYHGNEAGGPPAQWVPYPVTVPEGGGVTLSESVPTREGYRFTGWNTAPSGSGVSYQPGQGIAGLYSDVHLYAQWQPGNPPCRCTCCWVVCW